jgi:hypothetical protein
MLYTLDPVALPDTFPAFPPVPIAPTVPATFADADALAAWLNREPALAVGETAEALTLWPWYGEFGNTDLAVAVWCATRQDAAHVAGLFAYFCHGPLNLGDEWQMDGLPGWADTGRLFIISWDLTKSCRDDVAAVATDPAEGLEALLTTGSPIRKTDRMGAGTRGTRKWSGLQGRVLLAWR